MKTRSPLIRSVLLPLVAAISCGKGSAEDAVDPAISVGDRETTAVGTMRPTQDAADAALRRSYGPGDMTLQSCAKLGGDGTMVGENCASGPIVFGPYVRIPRDANVRLTFDIEATNELGIISDIVSSAGSVYHGGMEEYVLDPGATQHWGYAIRVFRPVEAAEARLWIRSALPANFAITNFKLTIE